MDLANIWVLTHKELRDAHRNRWFVLYSAAFAALALALAGLGLSGAGNYGFAGLGRTGASLINLVLLIVPLMGLSLGAFSLAGERERGTLLYLLAQPVTQLEVLMGKYLGLALALSGALTLGFGLSGLWIAWQGGAASTRGYLTLVTLAYLLALASLSLGFLLSAIVRKGATAIGLALFVWLALVFFGDLGLMGTALTLRLKADVLLGLALLNPLQVFKMAAILTIKSSLEVLGPAGLYALRMYGARLMPLLLTILMAWVLIPMSLTYLIFRQRGAL
ncbi:MAG: ABC transporter permease subunit [Anaerolineae bacterium]|nr:ABC transporter permease [Anaerolineae bacterium]MDW8098660.1 ABC transporter permease subunit [Anaerolineae bacterium]